MAISSKTDAVRQLLESINEDDMKIQHVVNGVEVLPDTMFSLTSPGKHEMNISWRVA